MVLTTLDFELTVHQPYKPLVAVLQRMGLGHGLLLDTAWNFVNDGYDFAVGFFLCLEFLHSLYQMGRILVF